MSNTIEEKKPLENLVESESEHKKSLKSEVRIKILGENEKKVILEQVGYVGEPPKKEVGLQGFICPKDGSDRKFSYCWTECKEHCHPLPVLLALAHQFRQREGDIYHVTEILNPPRIVYDTRNYPYYLNPNSIIDMHVGTSWHEKLEETKKYVKELGLEDDYLMEKNFKKDFIIKIGNETHLTTLSGTPDLYVASTKTLWDYKLMQYIWTFKYISEGKWDDSSFPWQMNIYRTYKFPEAEKMKLYCYLKDYKRNFPERYGVQKTEKLEVPWIPDIKVKDTVEKLLKVHLTNQLDPSNIRDCTEKEMWGNRIRCKEYCPIAFRCEQYKREKCLKPLRPKRENDKKRKRSVRKTL